MKNVFFPVAGLLFIGLSGCDGITSTPQMIDADGQVFIACHGMVWTSTEGGGLLGGNTTFKVSYTDNVRRSHVMHGIYKLTVSDPPEDSIAPFPMSPPDPLTTTDLEGRPFLNGKIYTWPDGTQAELTNGKWRPVRLNKLCAN